MAASTTTPVVTYGENGTVGRKDCGAGVPGQLVTVNADDFVLVGKNLWTLCYRCSPTLSGSVSWSSLDASVCWGCGGSGVHKKVGTVEEAVKVARKREQGRASRERAKARRAAAEAEAFKVWAAGHEQLVATLAPQGKAYAFGEECWVRGALCDFALRVFHGKALSDKQVAYAEALVAEQQEAAVEAAAVAAKQHYVGEVGAKVTVTGTVVVAYFLEAQNYGWASRTLFVVEGTGADEGATVKWVTSAAVDMGRGDEVELTATVKAHEQYEGTPQTVVTRAKVKVKEGAS
jgi:hypothetical protein